MDLSQFFLTKSQANDFATKLSSITDMMYTTDFDVEKALSSQFGILKKDAFLKLFRENNVNTASITGIQEFLKKIQESITTLPIVSLTIAFDPTDETLRTLSQWFVSNSNKQVLFDIHKDTTLIAGAKITYNGKFKDYSLGQAFNKILINVLQGTSQQQTPPLPIHQSTQQITVGR